MSNQDAPRVSDGQKIEWTEDLSVGIPELDYQHKGLLTIINKLVDHRNSSIYSEAVSSIFSGLTNYIKQHFSLEEEMMEKHGFSGLGEHRKQHIRFLREMVSMMAKPDHLTVEDLLNFLLKWFESHVRHDDQDYGRFFAEKGVS